MNSPQGTTAGHEAGRPTAQLTVLDAVSLVVGSVIGAGIYETAPEIAGQFDTPTAFLALWVLGGLVTLAGALCYAELAQTCPGEGGDYVYLTRAFGWRAGFLFSWMMFWVVRPANIGAMAFIFAHYAEQVAPLPQADARMVYAIGAVTVLTAINALGVRRGKHTQNLLTLIKVVGLAAVCAAGFAVMFTDRQPVAAATPGAGGDLALAMILVLFTYGGWRNVSFVAGEVIEPERNMTRVLLLGTATVTVIYLVTNLAYLAALGWHGVATSGSIAADAVRPLFGAAGAVAISLLIAVSCLGNINGMLFTDSRIYYAVGREHRAYRWLGRWDPELDSPLRALLVQAAVTLGLVLIVGRDAGAFERMVVFSSPAHWFFSALTASSLFMLRARGLPQGTFQVPGYPWVPLVFLCSTLFMLWASLSYAAGAAHPEAWAILAIFLGGLLAAWFDPTPRLR
jgi:amino acid transporter